ncbi:MAG: OB-fold domain-containing protein, partial [Actinobacteria bacterium]|nr:OB-fold domain-containing protein [Actinomycetota bacterium]
RRGTLWTFTTQGFVPKSPPYSIKEDPATYVPYAVGYVEFADQARVEGRILENDPEKLTIGMEMEVVVVPLRTDEHGTEIMTYAFKPVTETGAG